MDIIDSAVVQDTRVVTLAQRRSTLVNSWMMDRFRAMVAFRQTASFSKAMIKSNARLLSDPEEDATPTMNSAKTMKFSGWRQRYIMQCGLNGSADLRENNWSRRTRGSSSAVIFLLTIEEPAPSGPSLRTRFVTRSQCSQKQT
jgi:hypothetical protein